MRKTEEELDGGRGKRKRSKKKKSRSIRGEGEGRAEDISGGKVPEEIGWTIDKTPAASTNSK